MECQDRHAWRLFGNDAVAIAVADGAGSAKLAAIGASVASEAALRGVSEQYGRRAPLHQAGDFLQLVRAGFEAAHCALTAEAAARQACMISDLATTLIVVVATPEMAACGKVGDGACVAARTGGGLELLTSLTSQEYLNETAFLTQPDALKAVRYRLWSGSLASLAVLTDGLEMIALKMPDGTPHAPFFAPLFRFVKATGCEKEAQSRLTGFLNSARVKDRVDDDLTLLLAHWGNGGRA